MKTKIIQVPFLLESFLVFSQCQKLKNLNDVFTYPLIPSLIKVTITPLLSGYQEFKILLAFSWDIPLYNNSGFGNVIRF